MGYRWRGFAHPELYDMINKGPGPAASDPQTQYWRSLSEELTQVDQDLSSKLTSLGSRWEGQAADSAQAGLTPLASWASDAELGSNVMRVSSENQAEYIVDARARMPEPVEVTTQSPSTWDMVSAGAAALTGNAGPAAAVAAQAADHEAQEAAQSEAEQRAVETMRTYESSSTWNRETLGTFVAPPDVVVATPPPQGGTASAVLLSQNRAKNVAENGTGTSGGGTSQNPSGGQQVSTVNAPSGGGGGTSQVQTGSSGGGGGGGTVSTPPTVGSTPTATSPQDVFVPPPGSGPGPLPPTPGPGPLPPSPSPGPGPFPPGSNPFPFPGGGGDAFHNSNNASDVARRALPLRPGMPGQAGPFGPGGLPGGGPGGLPGGGAGVLDGERSPSQLGRGGLAGGVPGEGGVVRNGPGAAGAAGRPGPGGVHGPAGAGGRRADGEDDDEHFAPDYLMETDDVFGDDRRVAPTVIGE